VDSYIQSYIHATTCKQLHIAFLTVMQNASQGLNEVL